ncbi:MAG: hypothetical protein Q4C96_07770 [Planctomycetia bacterium]|nr:hypothetical protein [Planctomycetia bacterium]
MKREIFSTRPPAFVGLRAVRAYRERRMDFRPRILMYRFSAEYAEAAQPETEWDYGSFFLRVDSLQSFSQSRISDLRKRVIRFNLKAAGKSGRCFKL